MRILHSNFEFTILSTQCPFEYIHKSYIPQTLDTYNKNQRQRIPSESENPVQHIRDRTQGTPNTENLVPTEENVKSNKAVAERAHEEQ